MKISQINNNIYFTKTDKSIKKAKTTEPAGKTFKPAYYAPIFCAVKDLTPQYILKKRSHLLPERVVNKIKELCANPSQVMPDIKALHFSVYEDLFNSDLLEKAKELYPEFGRVINAIELKDNPSSAIAAIKKRMPLSDFSLAILKDLYSFKKEDELVEKYGFTNRSQLIWILQKLNIPKLNGNYNMIVKLTDENVSAQFAENANKTLRTDPEIEKRRIASILKTARSEEYREKKRLMSEEILKNNPHLREDTRLISQMTWDRCPEIRQVLSEYTKEQPHVLKKSLMNKIHGKELTLAERNIVNAYYRMFWNTYPDLKEKYSRTRHEVTQELKEKGLVK